MKDYTKLAAEIGALVTSKQQQYGDSVSKSGKILEILYPDGVQTHQYQDALLAVRILDKLSRIAQRGPDGQDLGGESPYRDIAGYGLLGASKDGSPVVDGLPHGFAWEIGGSSWLLMDKRDDSVVVALVRPAPGSNGWEYCCYIPRSNRVSAHGYADTAESAKVESTRRVEWANWGVGNDVAPVVEDADDDDCLMKAMADKSQQWDGIYIEYRTLGYRPGEAARMADEVCQKAAE